LVSKSLSLSKSKEHKTPSLSASRPDFDSDPDFDEYPKIPLNLVAVRRGAWIATLLGAGLVAGLAVATRPHFLPLALVLWLLLWNSRRPMIGGVLLYGCGLALALLSVGAVNHIHNGTFRILPTQGAYNLYAANRTGANGLYFTQMLNLSGRQVLNPARAESELLYLQQTGAEALPDAAAQNAHWRAAFLDDLTSQPLRMLRLWLFKAYAVVNSYEQYNNLTFGFHKERLVWLRFNPLSWGWLIVLAGAGWVVLWRRDRRAALALALLAAAYGASLILYYASARFRLPLVPLLAIAAAGVVPLVTQWRAASRQQRLLPLLAAGCIAVVTFSWFGGVRSTQTHIQDRLLLANAHADLARDADAARYARTVLQEQPLRAEALRIYALSYFNMQLSGDPALGEFGNWQDQRAWIRHQPPTDPAQDTVVGFYWWHWGERDAATALWQHIAETHGRNALLDYALGMAKAAGSE
jgi:hypothetical protein